MDNNPEIKTIEQKTIVTDIDNDDELMNRLKVATQHKEPTAKKAEEWNFDADETEINNIKSENTTQTTGTEKTVIETSNTVNKPVTKMTQSAKRSSARIAVGMLDLTQKGIFIPLLQRKYKKKFTPEEQELVLSIQDKNKKELDEKQIELSNKFDRLMNKMNKKIDEVPLHATEKSDLEEAWFTYFDVTEKDLPPIYLVTMAMINSVGKRAIDVFTD